MRTRMMVSAAAAMAVATGGVASSALAAGAPPAPKATNGAKVALVASGLQTPTSFAFGNGTIYEGDAGTEGKTPGGVYRIAGGKATRLPNSPGFVSGLAVRKGTLYVAGGFLSAGGATFRILAWSGWNGKTFKNHRAIYTAPKGFQGFNGLAFGPDGRLYVGVDVGLLSHNDHGAAKAPYQYDILSFDVTAKKASPKIVAQGIRQPWQMAFAAGDSAPYVTDFGQDKGIANPPDAVLHVKRGDMYGFPQCPLTSSQKCRGFAKPWKLFAPHTDNGGIAIVGKTMFLGQFGFGNGHPAVIAVSMTTKKVKTVVTSTMPNAIMAIGVHGGYLYIGTGAVGPGALYRTKL